MNNFISLRTKETFENRTIKFCHVKQAKCGNKQPLDCINMKIEDAAKMESRSMQETLQISKCVDMMQVTVKCQCNGTCSHNRQHKEP